MRSRMTTLAALGGAALAVALAPIAASAQGQPEGYMYRCVGKDGRKYYGQTMPRACIGRPVELLNSSGMVVKRLDQKTDAEKRAEKKAAAERKSRQAAERRETRRRNRAMLATYTSVDDIERARNEALEENRQAIRMVQERIGELEKAQAQRRAQMSTYAGKQPPEKLRQDIRNADIDLKAQRELLAAKRKDDRAINARYDEDRRQYLKATGRK